MTIRLNGYGVSYATFAAAEGLEAGALAKLSSNREVTAAGAGEAFIGLVVSVRDHLALVQLAGICTLPYTGEAPAVGYAGLAADGTGGIQAAEGGRQLLITAVDSTDNTAEVLL